MISKRLSRGTEAGVIALLLCGVSTQAFAQDGQAARIAALEAQVAALAAQIADLKKSVAAEAPAPAPAQVHTASDEPKPTTIVSITGGKPVIASSDGAFSINFHGVAQLDTASYFQDSPANASVVGPDLHGGANFRRARISIDGKLFGDFDYGLMLEMAGPAQLHEAYLQYNGLKFGDQVLRVRGGAFSPNVGLADATSQTAPLLLERAAAGDIQRSFAGADKRLGLQVSTNTDHWLASFALTGGKLSSGTVVDEQTAYVGRIAATPLYGEDWRVHLGANATYIARPPENAGLGGATAITLSERPELRNDPTSLITTGAIASDKATQVGVELAYQKGPFLVQSEYFQFDIARTNPVGAGGDPSFDGYYVDAGWMLTGEPRQYSAATGSFGAPKIARPFKLSDGQWGAWEIAARYSFMDLNFNEGAAGLAAPLGGIRGGEQEILAAALNWFPNSAVRFALQYQDVQVDRLNGAGTLQIGQDFRTLALRSQFAF